MNRYYIEKDVEEVTKLLASLQNTARVSRTHMARELQSTGLYAGQESVMELLAAGDGKTLGQLAAALGVKPPTITKTVSRLQEQNFVARKPSETDARQTHVWLTEQGRALLEQMQRAIRTAEARALDGVKKKERKQLAKILAKIDANLTGPDQPREKKKSSGGKKKK
ncbi:MarR family winged helix-turn-helix transcriptional regulator [Oricola nitratireducens]|jgi:DNA-binding MarR family transcriptional regulator|uniref:MarR family winged helix-turn-helix transcriptional regulator n=1 Tax=Oricola nitratireducens TaxID=2775868 RepID=UPI001865D07C|nr:MarR family transcriptional regulator [Oricola nitratireducens]